MENCSTSQVQHLKKRHRNNPGSLWPLSLFLSLLTDAGGLLVPLAKPWSDMRRGLKGCAGCCRGATRSAALRRHQVKLDPILRPIICAKIKLDASISAHVVLLYSSATDDITKKLGLKSELFCYFTSWQLFR